MDISGDLSLHRVGHDGHVSLIGDLQLVGCDAYLFEPVVSSPWPLTLQMQNGRYEGLPYYLQDMRPSGFLGNSFARSIAYHAGVHEDPNRWSDKETLAVLATFGSDVPGDFILGEPALRRFERESAHEQAVAEEVVDARYLARSASDMAGTATLA
jgi:hypothetical protein